MPERTEPRLRNIDPIQHHLLAHGRYGTREMCDTFGPDATFRYSLMVQGRASLDLSGLYPEIVPPEAAQEIAEKAAQVDPNRIRKLEEEKGHDVIAINSALQEVLSPGARPHVNKLRTSADTTETAKALQLRRGIEIYAASLENLRDILLERASFDWIGTPHMDVTHGIDALPTVFGRPFAYFAEAIQGRIDFLAHVHGNSLFGKWADATGCHHSASSMGVDGMRLQAEHCRKLELRYMIAPAQVPCREYLSEVMAALAISAQTLGMLGNYVSWLRSSDVGIARLPVGRSGSSTMPWKDAFGGNPVTEEQAQAFAGLLLGMVATSIGSVISHYARDLTGSASDRIIFDDGFKCVDDSARRLSAVAANLIISEERCRERFGRTYGTTAAQPLMNYLTDPRKTATPLSRDEAHALAARLATEAYCSHREFSEFAFADPTVSSLLSEGLIRGVTDTFGYIGQSKEQIQAVYAAFHGTRAFARSETGNGAYGLD